jgi:hypothetical protein
MQKESERHLIQFRRLEVNANKRRGLLKAYGQD